MCSEDLSNGKFLAISAGLNYFSFCSQGCFSDFGVACASPQGPCDFKKGNKETCLFVTNVGFAFEVRQEAEAFSQVFGNMFFIKVRHGSNLQNWISPGSDDSNTDENKSELKLRIKNLEKYKELKMFNFKLTSEPTPNQVNDPDVSPTVQL
jgi:hypothetical protein